MINFFLITFLAGLGLAFWFLPKQDHEPVKEEVVEELPVVEETAPVVEKTPKPKKSTSKMSLAKKKKPKTTKK